MHLLLKYAFMFAAFFLISPVHAMEMDAQSQEPPRVLAPNFTWIQYDNFDVGQHDIRHFPQDASHVTGSHASDVSSRIDGFTNVTDKLVQAWLGLGDVSIFATNSIELEKGTQLGWDRNLTPTLNLEDGFVLNSASMISPAPIAIVGVGSKDVL